MFICFKISARQTDHPHCLHSSRESMSFCQSPRRYWFVNEHWLGIEFMLKSFTFLPILDLGCFLILPFLNWQKASHYFFVIIIWYFISSSVSYLSFPLHMDFWVIELDSNPYIMSFKDITLAELLNISERQALICEILTVSAIPRVCCGF